MRKAPPKKKNRLLRLKALLHARYIQVFDSRPCVEDDENASQPYDRTDVVDGFEYNNGVLGYQPFVCRTRRGTGAIA